MSRQVEPKLTFLRFLKPTRNTTTSSVAKEEPSGMREVENANSKHHQRTIQRDEIPLIRDQIAVPTLQQLHGSIHAPDENGHDADRRGRHEQP